MPATDENRGVQLKNPFEKDLLFLQLSGAERLSQPFHFDLSLQSKRGDLSADQILGEPVAVIFDTPGSDTPRVFHGRVTDFAQVGYGERFHEYHATLRPWFWFLTRSADCRVFQDMSVEDIFRKLAQEHGFTDFQFKLSGATPKRVHCVQYRETAFNFLSRLLEEEGIYYYFEHTESRHVMVLVNSSGSHTTIGGYASVPYYPPSVNEARRERDHLTSWSSVSSVQPGAYATSDFDFEKPTNSLLGKEQFRRNHAQSSHEVFDHPAELQAMTAEATARIAKIRLEELQAGHTIVHGQGNAAGLACGARFKLTDHPRKDLNIEYLVTGASYSFAAAASETKGAASEDFHVSIDAIDLKQQYRPPRVTPKPVIQGAQTAIVVAARKSEGSNKEISTDKFGRVSVKFHWDRKSASSCWVRVAQVWAGKNWGTQYVPRIGHEVIVSFLEGDPDRPIITGSVYNNDAMPPYALPANATQSGIKSRSSEGGGDKNYNEIRFEDKKGSEELFIQAEKDLNVVIENDETAKVGNNRTREVKKDEKITVEGARTREVKKEENIKIGKTFKLDVADEITLVTGQSKLVMKKDGTVTLECMKLTFKAQQSIEINGQMKVEVKSLDVKVNGSVGVAIEGGVNAQLKGTMTKVEGTMLDLNGSGLAKLKGGMTMIG